VGAHAPVRVTAAGNRRADGAARRSGQR